MEYPNFTKTNYNGQEPFRLYFAGGTSTGPIDVFFKENNCLKLFTQVTDRRAIQKWIEEGPNNLFLDSGAWAAHSRGVELDVEEYIEYANSISEHTNAIAQVDKIPGVYKRPKTREQILEAPELSWKNYLYMKDKIKERDKLLPIFHQGEDFKWLENMLEYRHSDGSPIDYIGISPANDSAVPGKIAFMDKCFKIIGNSSNPNVKTHAFGMTSLYLLERYPFWSADSAGWAKKAAYGFVYVPLPEHKLGEPGYCLISFGERTKDSLHYINLSAEAKKFVDAYLEKIGMTVEELSTVHSSRGLANCMYLQDWANNYRFIGQSFNKRKLF